MDEIMDEYIQDYWKNNKNRWNYSYAPDIDFMVDDIAVNEADISD
ncbi:MAG: hypothetical protein ACPHY8_04965 [Patescibacteria group bacterium]